MTATLSDTDFVASANAELAALAPGARLQWAARQWPGQAVVSTSFGIQSAVMLHLISTHAPELPVIWIDTGYLFPETYRYAEQLQERLQVNLQVYQPLMSPARQEALYGQRWTQGKAGLEAYGLQNKVEPMNRALKDFGAVAWLSGLRRSQASSRAERTYVERQNQTFKLYPILDWAERDIFYYMQEHDLPQHPLWEQGYVSVGDVHSTSRLEAGMSAEDTRFGGVKRECGLHELSGQVDYQI